MTSAISIHPTVASPYPHSSLREHALIWALIASFALHMLIVLVIPKLQFEKSVLPEAIQVELTPPKKPEPLPQPEPVKPQITPEPKLIPTPRRIVEASPIAEPPPRAQPAPAPEPPPPPAVITAVPKVEPPPSFTAPPPPPPEPVRPTQDIDEARNIYGSLLGREIAKHKQYPKIAQMRGWQGEVIIDIQLDGNGNVQSSTIQKHSAYEALDKQALEMVKKASPFPAPPEALRGSSFNILVPVTFRLE